MSPPVRFRDALYGVSALCYLATLQSIFPPNDINADSRRSISSPKAGPNQIGLNRNVESVPGMVAPERTRRQAFVKIEKSRLETRTPLCVLFATSTNVG